MKKVLTVAVAALTIATTIAVSTANVDAKGFKAPGGGGGGGGGGAWKMPHHKGGGGKWVGYGIAAGVLTAAAYGAYATCDRVPVFNRFGEVVGYRCEWY